MKGFCLSERLVMLAVVADVVAVAAVVVVDAVEDPVLGRRSPHSLHRATMNNTKRKRSNKIILLQENLVAHNAIW